MIAKIAVSAANFAIDKPYSYRIPDTMTLLPGQRVQLPFGRGNHRTEGVVLSVEEGEDPTLKCVECCLDEEPLLTDLQLRLGGQASAWEGSPGRSLCLTKSSACGGFGSLHTPGP